MRILIFLLFSSFISLAQDNNNLAYQYYINGEYKKAIKIYESLSKQDVPITSYYRGYYSCLLKAEDFKKAESLALKIYKLYPSNLSFQLEIGIAQEKLGKIKNSKYTYKKVFQNLEKKQNQTINLANTFIRHDMHEKALEIYLFSESLNPSSNYRMQKAQVYSNLGNVDLMIQEYLNMLKYNPKNKSLVISRIQNFLDNDGIRSDKNYKLVKNLLLPYVREEQNSTYFAELLIWLFMQNAQYDMALRQAKSLDIRTSSGAKEVYELAEVFLDKKYYNLAVEAYNYIINKGKDNEYFIISNINKLYALTKNIDKNKNSLLIIDQKYREIIQNVGENAKSVLLLSNHAHFQAFYLNDLEAASNTLNIAMSIPNISKRDLAECKLEYADIMLLEGNIWQALLYYSQVEKDFKENPIGHEAKFRRARISYYKGDFQWAQAQLDVLKASTSKLISNDAMQLSLLITDNYNLDTSEVAMQIFAYAEMLSYQQKYGEALYNYDSLLTHFNGHTLSDEIYIRKAKIYLEQDSTYLALEMCQKIINEWSFDILADDALYMQAKIYEDILDESEKAMSSYEAILLLHSGSIYTVESRKRFRQLRGDNINLNE